MEIGSDDALPADANDKIENKVAAEEQDLADEQDLVANQPIQDDPGRDYEDPSGG